MTFETERFPTMHHFTVASLPDGGSLVTILKRTDVHRVEDVVGMIIKRKDIDIGKVAEGLCRVLDQELACGGKGTE